MPHRGFARPRMAAAVVLLLSQAFALVARDSDPVLKCADSFSILGASGVFNKGRSKIYGDVGVKSGAGVIGLPPGAVKNGAVYLGGPIAQDALSDALVANHRLMWLRASNPIQSGAEGNLGGLKLSPGVYALGSSARLSGTLRLDAGNRDYAFFVFQIGTTLTTGENSAVVLLNPGRRDAVYWQVGGSAKLGRNTSFKGNILAQGNITMDVGAKIQCGGAFALTGAVIMDRNLVSNACESPPTPILGLSGGFMPAPYKGGFAPPLAPVGVSSPEPNTFWLAAIFLAILIALRFHLPRLRKLLWSAVRPGEHDPA
jgi:hypothetical protein